MLTLHVEETEVQSGSVRVGWTVDQETLKTMADSGCLDPHVLLVTAPKEGYSTSRETRKIVPLRDLVTYVDFKCAGENRLFGILLYNGTPKEWKTDYLSKRRGSWETNVLDYDGERTHHSAGPLWTAIEIAVPKEVFAKQPPAWEKKWVYAIWSTPATDQCEYRKHRLFAYTVQPIIMAAAVALAAVVGALFYLVCLFMALGVPLFGLRGFRWKRLAWPFSDVSMDALYATLYRELDGNVPRSVFIRHDLTWKAYVLLPCMPVFPLTAFLIIWGVTDLSPAVSAGWSLLGAVGLAALALIAGFVLTAVIGKAIAAYERSRRTKRPDYLDDPLLLAGRTKPRALKDLPQRRRSIRLRYLDLKAKVCRPFSG